MPNKKRINATASPADGVANSEASVATQSQFESNAEKAAQLNGCGTQPTPETALCLWNEGRGKDAMESWYEDMGECTREPVRSLVEGLLPWRKEMDRGGCGLVDLQAGLGAERLGLFRDSDKPIEVTINGVRKMMMPREARYAALDSGAATAIKDGRVDQMLCGPDIEGGCEINQWRPLPQTAEAVNRNRPECELETRIFGNHQSCAELEAQINRKRNTEIPRKMAETGRSAETIVYCESLARSHDANVMGAETVDLMPLPGPGTGLSIIDAVWEVLGVGGELINHNRDRPTSFRSSEDIFEQCLDKTRR